MTDRERYLEKQPKVLTLYVEIRIARDRESDKGTKYEVQSCSFRPKGKSELKPERHKGKVKGIGHLPHFGVKIGLKSYIILLRY